MTAPSFTHLRPLALAALLVAGSVVGCQPASDPEALTAEMPVHLEERLGSALVEGSEVPAELPDALEWHFDAPRTEWQPLAMMNPHIAPATVEMAEDALRISVDASNDRCNLPWVDCEEDPDRSQRAGGVMFTPEEALNARDYAYAVVRARPVGAQGCIWSLVNFNEIDPLRSAGLR